MKKVCIDCHLITLLFLAIISFSVFNYEVIRNGWAGLVWIKYNYASFLMIPIFYFIWLNTLFNKKLSIKVNILLILNYIFTFAFILGLFSLMFISGPSIILIYKISLLVFLRMNIILILLIIMLTILLSNIISWKILNIEYTLIDVVIHFCLELIVIPLSYFFMLIFMILNIIPRNHVIDICNPIFLFKTGSVIPAMMIYEGILFIHGRQKLTIAST